MRDYFAHRVSLKEVKLYDRVLTKPSLFTSGAAVARQKGQRHYRSGNEIELVCQHARSVSDGLVTKSSINFMPSTSTSGSCDLHFRAHP